MSPPELRGMGALFNKEISGKMEGLGKELPPERAKSSRPNTELNGGLHLSRGGDGKSAWGLDPSSGKSGQFNFS